VSVDFDVVAVVDLNKSELPVTSICIVKFLLPTSLVSKKAVELVKLSLLAVLTYILVLEEISF